MDVLGKLLSPLVISAVVGVVLFLYRKYKKSAGKELLPFAAYIAGSVRLHVGRWVMPTLTRQLALRRIADESFRGFPAHMLVPSLSEERLDIDSAYIRLHLTGAEHDHVTDSDLLQSTAESSLIFGEPGSGKSSLTQKLFRDYCKQASARPATSRLPLHAELGSIPWEKMPSESEDRPEWLQNQVAAKVLKSPNIYDPQKVLDSFLDGPGVRRARRDSESAP